MKNIRVLYFGRLRQERGQFEEILETGADQVCDLYSELRQQHGLSFPLESLRIAINDEFAETNTRLANNMTVAYMPPMAGG